MIESDRPTGSGDATSAMTRAELRAATLRSVRWVSITRLTAEAIGFLSMLALARLIAPAAFGSAAMAYAVAAVAMTVVGESFGSVLVQRQHVTNRQLEGVAFLSIACGAFLTVVMLVGATFLEPVLGSETSRLIQLLSPSALLTGLSTVAQATVLRELDFRLLSIIEVLTLISSVAVTLGLAIAGLEATALILGRLTGIVLSAALILARARMPLPRYRSGVFRDLRSFGAPAALAGLVYTAFRYVDLLVIGARLGAAQVGFFWRAFNLAFEYQSKVTAILQQVLFPVLSRAKDLDDMRAIRIRMVRVHASILFPLLMLLIAVAPVAVPFLYGEQWVDAVVPTQILALAGMTVAIGAGVGPLILAAGRPRLLLVANALALVMYAPAVYFAAPLGLVEVCSATVAVYLVKTLCVQYFILDRRIGIPLAQLGGDAGPAFISGLGGLAPAWPVVGVLQGLGLPSFVVLAAASSLFAIAYLSIMRTMFRPAWNDLLVLVQAIVGNRRFPPPASRRPKRQVEDRA